MLLNNQWITEEIKEDIKNYLETDENENTTIQYLWDTAKVGLRKKFIMIQAYLRKQEKAFPLSSFPSFPFLASFPLYGWLAGLPVLLW